MNYQIIMLGSLVLTLISCTPEPSSSSNVIPQNPQISEKITSNPSVEFIGEARLPTGLIYENTEFGGLSGITYDANSQKYYAISDDRSQKAPARFYGLKIEFNPVRVLPEITVTTLSNESQQTFAPGTLDPEGIALTNQQTFWISNEQIIPWIKEFSLEGKHIKNLPISEKYIPDAQNTKGVRDNLSLESLTITSDNQWLFTATENALIQDGSPATLNQGSPSRILQYNLLTGKPEKEFLYVTEPVADVPKPPESLHTNGLVELLAIDETNLLSLERSYSNGVGNTILLFEVSLAKASDIQTINSLSSVDISQIKPAEKRLLLDLRSLNIPLDNIEAMTFGPILPDGRRSLLLMSDNNFNPLQVTQILVFALSDE
jgi:hypothetical protein